MKNLIHAATTALFVLALATSAAADKKEVDATLKIGAVNCTKKMTLDSGATGEGASEITRANAIACGLLDAAGDPKMDFFEPDPTDATKPKKKSYTQADGTSIDYALTKPIEICVTDSAGNECCATIRITIICDKTKSGSNLLGKAWLKAVKAVWDFETDKLKWPKVAVPEGDKKSKATTTETSGTLGIDYDAYDHLLCTQGGQTVDIPAVPSGFDFTIIPQWMTQALPPMPLIGQVDIAQDADMFGMLLKNGFSSFSTNGVLDLIIMDQIELPTLQGPVTFFQVPVLVNDHPQVDFVLFGQDLLAPYDTTFDSETDNYAFGEPPLEFPWLKIPDAGVAGGLNMEPDLSGSGSLLPGSFNQIVIDHGLPNSGATLIFGFGQLLIPFKGGLLVPTPDLLIGLPLDPLGSTVLPFLAPPGLSGLELQSQALVIDPGGPKGFAITDGMQMSFN